MYKLYHGDCLDVMQSIPDNSIDLIITDPPYELENHGGGKNGFSNRELTKNTNEYVGFMSNGFDYDSIFSNMVRVCKIPNMFIFCSNKQVSKIMSWFERKNLAVTLLVWNKTNPVPFCNGKYISDLEFIVHVRGKGAKFNNSVPFDYKKKLYSSPVVSKKDRIHTAQKPLGLLRQYIELCSDKGDTVLDCFMGSGSTGVACIETDRNFIGIELDKTYFDLAKNRIDNYCVKNKLF